MAISVRASGTWSVATTQSPAYTIPAGYQAGDLGILVSTWRPYTVTATVNQSWVEIIDESPGTTGNGVGVGSTRVYVAYKVLAASETNPTLTRSAAITPGGGVIIVLQKAATDGPWTVEKIATAVEQAMGSTAMSHALTTTAAIKASDWIFALTGVADDSATFTRATTAISGGPSWSGNVVERPATHATSTTGNDMAADLIYRIASSDQASGASITVTATLSAAERVASTLFRVYAPQLITPGLIDSGSAIYAPTVANASGAPQGVTLGLIDASSAIYSPTLVPKSTIALGLIDAVPTVTDYADEVLADTPVGYWRLGEPSGTAMADSSGNGNGGTVAGTYTLAQPGLVTGADDALGLTSGQVTTSDIAGASIGGGAVTVEFWATKPAVGAATVVGKNAGSNYEWAVGFDSSDLPFVQYNVWSGGGADAVGGQSTSRIPAYNAPVHVAVVFDEANDRVKVYINGVLDKTDTATWAQATTNGTAGVTIGQRGDAVGYFAGVVDEVAIYSGELSGARIAAHFAAGGPYRAAIIADGPVAYWRLGEPSGTLALNAVGPSAIDGTYRNAPTLGAAGPLAADTDTAVTLNGTDEDVLVSSNAVLSVGDLFSIEAWIKVTGGTGTNRKIVTRGSGDGFTFCIRSDDTIKLGRDAAPFSIEGGTAITDSNWHHVVAVKDGDTIRKIYVDGVDDTAATATSTNTASSNNLYIGSDGGGEYFTGSIDEVALYDYALSAGQVAAHYAASIGGVDRIYAPTVTLAPYPITLGLIDAGSAIYAPTVANAGGSTQGVTVPLIDATSAIYAPTLTPKNLVSLGLIDSGSAIYAPTVTTRNAISLGVIDSGSAIYAPTVGRAPYPITVPLIDSGSAIYAPTLLTKNTIALGLIDSGSAIYAPTVVRDEFIDLGLIDAGSAIYAPTLVGKNLVALDVIDSGSAIYAPSLTLAPYPITLGLIDAGSAIYAPTVSQSGAATQTILPDVIDSGSAIYAPTLATRNAISLGLITSTSAIYAPVFAQDVFVDLGLITSTSAVYSITVGPRNTIAIPVVDSGSAIYAPTLTVGPVTILLDLIDGAPAVYAPTVANAGFPAQSVVLGLIDSGNDLYPPTVANTIAFLVGFTRNATGQLLPGCEVHVFRTSDDVEIAQVTSNGSAVYSVQVVPGETYYVVAYKAGSPDVAGTTVNTLVGV